MKKQVVVLINGFGIEQKRSYAIYDSFLMPNLDHLTQECFFSTLKNNAYNDNVGYQYFSTGTDVVPSYLRLDNWLNEQIKVDPTMIEYQKKFNTIGGNIHLFCMVSNEKVYGHIKEFLNFLNPLNDKKIYLHAILDFPFVDDYARIGKILSRLNYDLDDKAILKVVLGKHILENKTEGSSKDLVRMLYKKFGEQWREIDKKMAVLEKTKISPKDVKPFCTDTNFELNDEDTILFFNYDQLKLNDFMNEVCNPNRFMNAGKEIHHLNFESLFPSMNGIPSIYQKNNFDKSFALNLETMQKKALIITEKEHVNSINFYLNGYENRVSPCIRYMTADTPTLLREDIVKQLLSNNEDIIMLNYFVDDTDKTEELKEKLRQVDTILPVLKQICEENQYSLWITSLYGMKKEMLSNTNEKVLVDFSEKVPLLFYDDNYLKKSNKLLKGNLYDFHLTLIKMIHPESNIISLISKKGMFG